MKKSCIVILVFIAASASLWAAVFPNHFGASIALGGRSDSMLQTSLSFSVIPFHLDFMTPFLFAEAYVQLSDTALEFGGLRGGGGFEIMYISEHPFGFLAANPTVWSPALFGGISYEDHVLQGYMRFSIFRFMEKDAIYEYLSPFCDFSKAGLERLGVLLFRFSGLF
ncbi:MAG: hypothetical protein SO135_07915 [Sphaerochaetaceae bacterium]|jgi:hypothetical protein|nr:hypothetical protein [Sphaerochaetaceae bacterium]NLY07365.1 hypothetical protein [Spirochaetales bacterium]